MNVVEAISFVHQSVNANRLRAGLTMLGMVIGTASIILVVTIAMTGRDYILKQIEGLGSNLIYLYCESSGTVSGSRTLADDLTLGDLKQIQALRQIGTAAGVVTSHDRLVIDGAEKEISVIGTTPEYKKVRNLRIVAGRCYDEFDDRSSNRVCLLTEELARKLFGTLNIEGRSIKLFQVRFETIGIFREGVETFGVSEVTPYSVLIPLSVLQRFNMTDRLDLIYASARSNAYVPMATQGIQQLMDARHRSGSAYRIENLAQMLKAAGRIANALTIVLILIAAISLVISGIGIMNIMLVTVTERTKEIGIKMAVGARPREILYQFLCEAVFLSTTGGSVGILVGITGPLLTNWITGLRIPISTVSILVAFGLSVVVGVTFGIIPANRAARLHPVAALHFE
jgi:putative ABC transport system permease protein